MVKRKGKLQEAQEEMARVESLMGEHGDKVTEFKHKANALRNSQEHDYRVTEYEEEVTKHMSIIENIKFTLKRTAEKCLRTAENEVVRLERNLEVINENRDKAEINKMQLERKYREHLNQLDAELDTINYDLEQAQLELDDWKGN